MYKVIQSPGANTRTFQIVSLPKGSRVSPAGYVIGPYTIVGSNLSIEIARNLAEYYNHRNDS